MKPPHDKVDALGELSSALSGSELSLNLCLRNTAESSVFSGEMAGRPVVLKQFHINGPARVARMQAELALVAAQMQGGPHGINQFLLGLPDLGIAVLEHVGNTRLSAVIATTPHDRTKLITQSADWLLAYIGERRRTERFRPRRWIDHMDTSLSVLDGQTPIVRSARRQITRIARNLAGTDFTRAATHGDFVSINAMWDNGRIIGVDVQGESWLPLARDVARFLVWQELTDPAPGPRLWGIAQSDLAAFLAVPLLDKAESKSQLPLFIGLELLKRLADLRSDPSAIQRGLNALRHWCADASTIQDRKPE